MGRAGAPARCLRAASLQIVRSPWASARAGPAPSASATAIRAMQRQRMAGHRIESAPASRRPPSRPLPTGAASPGSHYDRASARDDQDTSPRAPEVRPHRDSRGAPEPARAAGRRPGRLPGSPSPRAHAAFAFETGIGDEHPEMFSNPLWLQLHTKITRYIAPYDAAVRPYSLALARAFDGGRRSAPPESPDRLLPLRVHADGHAERRHLPARRAEVRPPVPPRPRIPVMGRVQPRQHPRSPCQPLGGVCRPLLPGADPRLPRLHRQRP